MRLYATNMSSYIILFEENIIILLYFITESCTTGTAMVLLFSVESVCLLISTPLSYEIYYC